MTGALYAVYNRDCGHVLGVHNNRAAFEPMVTQMQAQGCYSLRTRKATDFDIVAVLRDEMCDRCKHPKAVSA